MAKTHENTLYFITPNNGHICSQYSVIIHSMDRPFPTLSPLRSQGTSTWLSSQLRLWLILIPCFSGNWNKSTNKSQFSHHKIEHQLFSVQQWLLIHTQQPEKFLFTLCPAAQENTRIVYRGDPWNGYHKNHITTLINYVALTIFY